MNSWIIECVKKNFVKLGLVNWLQSSDTFVSLSLRKNQLVQQI